MRVLNSSNVAGVLLIAAAIGGVLVPSCSKRGDSAKDRIEAMRRSLLFEAARFSKYWANAPVTYDLVPKMEAAARFLEGRKSIDVPYIIAASIYPARAPDTGLTLGVSWMETGYSASRIELFIDGRICDIQFPKNKVREDRSPLLEDVERELHLHGTLNEDSIEWHISNAARNSGTSSAAIRGQTTPIELITGQALLSIRTDTGRRSNSVDIFIHPDVRRMVEERSK